MMEAFRLAELGGSRKEIGVVLSMSAEQSNGEYADATRFSRIGIIRACTYFLGHDRGRP